MASWGVNEFTILHSSAVPAKNTHFSVFFLAFFSDKDVFLSQIGEKL